MSSPDAASQVGNDSSTLYTPPALPQTDDGPKTEFLRLLVAEMQHQDPLKPQEGSEFVAQLAQFANIELGVETNKHLGTLEQGQSSASRASLMALVGKHITASADSFTMGEKGDMPDLQVHLADPAIKVTATVYDEAHNAVATIEGGPHAAGDMTLQWDGTDDNGIRLPQGNYSIEVVASGGSQGVVDATVAFSGNTDSVHFAEDGSTQLGLGGVFVSPGSIASVSETA